MKYLLVADCNDEDIKWTRFARPNSNSWFVLLSNMVRPMGREAEAWLKMISRGVFAHTDEIVLAQGNPFDHDPAFLAHLDDDSIRYFGEIHECDPTGMPACDYANLHAWSDVLGLEKRERYKFVAGAQYRITGEQIWARPHNFWEALALLSGLSDNKAAWSIERLWPVILGIEL